jgi:hypothetical protein
LVLQEWVDKVLSFLYWIVLADEKIQGGPDRRAYRALLDEDVGLGQLDLLFGQSRG